MLPAPPQLLILLHYNITYITGVLGDPNRHTVPHQELWDNKVPVLKGFHEHWP